MPNRKPHILVAWLLRAVLILMAAAHASAQAQTAQAQQGGVSAEPAGARRIKAVRVTGEIRVDGVLNEAEWTQAAPATGFRQQEPYEGTPATERTEVRVLYDNKYLYLGVRAFDSEPARINARELARDASFANDDKIETQLEYYENRAGKLETRQTELTWDTEFQNSSVFGVRLIEDVTDVLKEPFRIRPGIVIPPGSYHFNRPRVSFSSNQSKRVVFNVREKWGGFYTGQRYETAAGVTLQFSGEAGLSLYALARPAEHR